MRKKSREDVMAVLPDGFSDNEGGFCRDRSKHLHAVVLAVDETVLLDGVEGMRSSNGAAESFDGSGELPFHRGLCCLTVSIGSETKVTACCKKDGRHGDPL
jgi:hypothetical protein